MPYVVEVTKTLNVTLTYLLPQICVSNTDIIPKLQPIYTVAYWIAPPNCTQAVPTQHVQNWTHPSALPIPHLVQV